VADVSRAATPASVASDTPAAAAAAAAAAGAAVRSDVIANERRDGGAS